MDAKKEILLGVCGGVSAYKAADLLRRLQDAGYAVSVIPTKSSLNFVGISLWETLSGRKVPTSLWSDVTLGSHIEYARKSDLILVAPSTADFLARIAQGEANDLLSATILASSAPKILVPAMHTEMWLAPSTQYHVEILRSRGFEILDPEEGRLSGSESGVGRFPEVHSIIKEVDKVLEPTQDLAGKKILVTAGGTREPIDPVRFIGNISSGKQGIALAEEANARGANVFLILANVNSYSHSQIRTEYVKTASELNEAVIRHFPYVDALIMSAAVADARPVTTSDQKFDKAEFQQIMLEPTEDILMNVSKLKKRQIVFGFAAQTNDHFIKATEKLSRKNLDFIYVNDVSHGAIFGSDMTHGTIIDQTGRTSDIEEMRKSDFARIVFDLIRARLG